MTTTTRRPKAADINDTDMLRAVYEQVLERGLWTNTTAVAERYPKFPPKVVAAKLAQLHKRGLLSGCPCGCRGDWELTDLGRDILRPPDCPF